MIRNYLHSSNNSWAQVSWAKRHSIPKRQMPLSPELFCYDQTGRLANSFANNLSACVMQLVLGIPAEVNADAFSCQCTTLTDSFASSSLERERGQIPALKKNKSDLVCISFIVQCCHPFSSMPTLRSGIKMCAPRTTATACKSIELLTALCLFCVCFLCTH